MRSDPMNISGWEREFSVSTYGARKKGICSPPDSDLRYYFKHSDQRYPWEFWNEILAYRIGKILELDVAEYIPAYYFNPDIHSTVWGCLSPFLNRSDEEFVHGQSLILEHKPDFDKKRGTDHSYQLIRRVFLDKPWTRSDCKKNFYKMIVFDALLCNRDRHQENWAIIQDKGTTTDITVPAIEESEAEADILKFFGILAKQALKLTTRRFSPIYDNGSSLGHNLLDSKLIAWLSDKSREQLNKYAFGKDATAHIRWDDELMLHDDLMRKLLETEPALMMEAIQQVCSKFDRSEIEALVQTIDEPAIRLDDKYPDRFRLHPARKQFIVELLYLRHQKLCELL